MVNAVCRTEAASLSEVTAEKSIPVAVYSVPDRLMVISPAFTALIAANAAAGDKVSPRTNGAAPSGVSL